MAGATSAPLNARAVGEMLTDWPSYSAGLTSGICDLKTLKLMITSDDLSDDHKAMWVSLVQTIVHEPDQRSVLLCLQNLLSGDLTASDSLINRPKGTRVSEVTYLQWAVTGSISKYASEKRKWSAAHVVDLALWVGGPDADLQAARALKIFGVWGPSGEFIMSYGQHSIKTCLEPETILCKIWPSAIGSEDIVAWANLHQPSTNSPFVKFEDAHKYLLRQCIGADLTLFPRWSRDPATAGDASNRMISRAYFDSTLAPLLKEYFDADVDLELAYSAAVESQGRSIDRGPVEPKGLSDVPRQPPVLPKEPFKPRKANYHQEYEYEDDEETFPPRRIKPDPDTQQPPPRVQQHPPQVRLNNRGLERRKPEESKACLAIIRQIARETGGIVPRPPFAEISRRLRAEHNIDRTNNSIRIKWNSDWCGRTEFRVPGSRGDNDDSHGINKKNKIRQKTYGYEDESEEAINHPGAVSEDDESACSTDREAAVGLPPREEYCPQ
jgi:hypothetical protein